MFLTGLAEQPLHAGDQGKTSALGLAALDGIQLLLARRHDRTHGFEDLWLFFQQRLEMFVDL